MVTKLLIPYENLSDKEKDIILKIELNVSVLIKHHVFKLNIDPNLLLIALQRRTKELIKAGEDLEFEERGENN